MDGGPLALPAGMGIGWRGREGGGKVWCQFGKRGLDNELFSILILYYLECIGIRNYGTRVDVPLYVQAANLFCSCTVQEIQFN